MVDIRRGAQLFLDERGKAFPVTMMTLPPNFEMPSNSEKPCSSKSKGRRKMIKSTGKENKLTSATGKEMKLTQKESKLSSAKKQVCLFLIVV